MMLTETESRALAAAIHSMRPEWEVPGIHKALGHARTKANKWIVAQAAFAAAANPTNRTPAVIPMEGKHWPIMSANQPPSSRRFKPNEVSDDERDAAHRQYLAAVAILQAKKAGRPVEPSDDTTMAMRGDQ